MIRMLALFPVFAIVLACDPATAPVPTPDDTGIPICVQEDDANVIDYFVFETCIAAAIHCDEGVYFEDECGCGCIEEDPIPECIDPDTADVLQYQPLDECAASLIGCDAGGTYFEDSCGCGCLLE